MPDIKYAKKDDIPEELREHAEEKDGAFVVAVAPAKKVKEFRDNNVLLKQKLETVEPRLASLQAIVGDDPDKFKGELAELRDVHQQVKDGKLQGSKKVQEEVDARLAAARKDHEDQLKAVNTKLQATEQVSAGWEGRFKRLSLHQQLTTAVTAKDSGALVEALPDILSCGEQDWKVQEDGSLLRMDRDVKVYGANGDPMTPQEWLAELLKKKPYFAKASAGGGATGGREGGTPNGMTSEAFQKLPPQERLRIKRAQAANQR